MSNNLSTVQQNQNTQYSFPYHYVAQYEPNFTQGFNYRWGINYVSTIEYMLHKLEQVRLDKVLDIGCGDGRLSREISLKFSDSLVTGIDYSEKPIQLAIAMNQDRANLRFISCDIEKFSPDEPFDVAVLMEVFEHIPIESAQNFIANVRRVISKNGYLFLTVPHANVPVHSKHFQHFNVQSISNFLQPYFTIAEVVPFEKVCLRRTLMSKFLTNKIFSINYPPLLNKFYQYYKNYLFMSNNEGDCQRIFVKAIAI